MRPKDSIFKISMIKSINRLDSTQIKNIPTPLLSINISCCCKLPEPTQELETNKSEIEESKPVRNILLHSFYLNESTHLRIITSQLTDYSISIEDVKNAEVDTTLIDNSVVTINSKRLNISIFSISRFQHSKCCIFSYMREKNMLRRMVN